MPLILTQDVLKVPRNSNRTVLAWILDFWLVVPLSKLRNKLTEVGSSF